MKFFTVEGYRSWYERALAAPMNFQRILLGTLIISQL
jgi:hypothetical protein